MKTILWATLTANGNYARSTPAHPPRPEALADFATQVGAASNFIVGRQTFQEFQSQPQRSATDAGAVFAQADVVVVSRSAELKGPAVVTSPQAALAYLRERGHATALLAGGERLHNAFLAEGLVDELCLNFAPTFEDEGLRLRLPPGGFERLQLLDSRALGGGVWQLRYAFVRA
ncbi:MAG: dihydrofolate reductase [Myxococcales bacterium]|nr:MAG: dihydrofolate reductase [Myxococcales bacterium]